MTPDAPFNVLFLYTGNSARSVLAESIMNCTHGDRFRAYSAGSDPRGEVHPKTIELLRRLNFPTEGLRSKSWDEFATGGKTAVPLDFIITVCDDAAGETCPVWPGHPITAHWGIEDPAAEKRGEMWERAAFLRAFHHLRNRISVFAALPVDKLERTSLTAEIRAIGRLDDTTASVPKAAGTS
ncbi:arsenate reductase ArsC [Aurantimonas sp. A3-2-R12]|uniref:arsenate reductase ArsC n=1 Tax=Aurantimonas sp. A3-2-R12 TaxID=3114362 RepID=UPI002E16B660|nr:arsenate reductase ArsC [Aurantimonas sp. A3-2-R12]